MKASVNKRTRTSASAAQSRRLWLWSVAVAITLLAIVFCYPWRTTPVSDDAYQLSSSLFAACNLQDAKRLEAVAACMSSITEDHERERLTAAIDLAREGQWQGAMQQARRLMESRTQ